MATGRDFTTPPLPLPYSFTLDGHSLTVRSRPTRWWIRTMSAKAPGFWLHALVLNLEGEGPTHLLERLHEGDDPFDLDDAEQLAEEVLAAVMGMEMWAAHRLMSFAYSNWITFDGWCLTNGFDPVDAVPGRVAAAVFAWRLSHCEKKNDVAKLQQEVFGPPPVKRASGRLRDAAPRSWSEAAESAAFEKALADMGRG